MNSTAARLTELEARYTLQQDMLQKLSDVLWQQQKDLDALSGRVVALERRVLDLAAADQPDDEAPPHY